MNSNKIAEEFTGIREKYPDVVLDISYSYAWHLDKGYGVIIVDRILVPKEKRKQGIGSEIMKTICLYAYKTNSILMLTPSNSLGGTSTERLRKFYKRFGFINNRGKTKIFQLPNYGMYRFPKEI